MAELIKDKFNKRINDVHASLANYMYVVDVTTSAYVSKELEVASKHNHGYPVTYEGLKSVASHGRQPAPAQDAIPNHSRCQVNQAKDCVPFQELQD